MRINPDNAIAHNNLGVVFARKGNAKEAVSQFSEAIRIDPDYAGHTITWGKFLPIREKLKMQFDTIEKHCRSIPA